MKLDFIGRTDKGKMRSVNQDSHYVDPDGRFFIVADGMGGHAGGEEASKIATEKIKLYLEKHWNENTITSDVLLKEAIKVANEGILEDQSVHPERGDMGTTVVITIFRHGQSWRAHVGDSRLYVWSPPKSELKQITDDHTWVSMAVKSGELPPEQAQNHPWRHVLSQCLGRKDLLSVDIQELKVQSGDLLLMCSDGLTEEVPDFEISTFLKEGKSCEEIAENLITAANLAGGSDNITVVIVVQE